MQEEKEVSEKREVYRGPEGVVYCKKTYGEPERKVYNIDTTQEKNKKQIVFWVV